jgi:hypothetical protein
MTLSHFILVLWASLSLMKCLKAVGVRQVSHPSHPFQGHPSGFQCASTPGWTGLSPLSGVGLLPVLYRSQFQVLLLKPTLLASGPNLFRV